MKIKKQHVIFFSTLLWAPVPIKTDIFEDIGTFFEEEIVKPIERDVIKPIESFFKDPGAAFNEALKQIGLDIIRLVNSIKNIEHSVHTMPNQINNIKNNITGPNGPIEKGKSIAQEFEKFQKSAEGLINTVSTVDLNKALTDTLAFSKLLETLSGEAVKTLHALDTTSKNITQHINTTNIYPIISDASNTMKSIALILDNVINARNSVGSLGELFLPTGIINLLNDLKGNLQIIGTQLSIIANTPTPNIDTLLSKLLNGLLTNLDKIPRLTKNIQMSVEVIQKEITQVTSSLPNLEANINALKATGENIGNTVSQRLKNEIDKNVFTGIAGAISFAIDEFNNQIKIMHNQAKTLLKNANVVINSAMNIAMYGIMTLHNFKATINVELVPEETLTAMGKILDATGKIANTLQNLGNALL